MKRLSLLIALAFTFASCGKHIIVSYSAETQNGATLHLKPTQPVSSTHLTINDRLLVEEEYVRKITVRDLPAGIHTYHFTCNNSRYTEKADDESSFKVENGEEKTRLIDIPPVSNGAWINTGLSTLSTWAAIIVILQLTDDDD